MRSADLEETGYSTAHHPLTPDPLYQQLLGTTRFLAATPATPYGARETVSPRRAKARHRTIKTAARAVKRPRTLLLGDPQLGYRRCLTILYKCARWGIPAVLVAALATWLRLWLS